MGKQAVAGISRVVHVGGNGRAEADGKDGLVGCGHAIVLHILCPLSCLQSRRSYEATFCSFLCTDHLTHHLRTAHLRYVVNKYKMKGKKHLKNEKVIL